MVLDSFACGSLLALPVVPRVDFAGGRARSLAWGCHYHGLYPRYPGALRIGEAVLSLNQQPSHASLLS